MRRMYNKLVRDKIPAIIIADGKQCHTKILNDADYATKLNEKLLEECSEYLESNNPEELADILEVVYAIASLQGITADELEKERHNKAKRRGGFEKRILLKEVVEE